MVIKGYVVGFYFKGSQVLLIQKNRPKWQKGQLNGIGGHVRNSEPPLGAMVREFKEETGTFITPGRWSHFCTMFGNDFAVKLYRTDFVHGDIPPKTMTDERIVWAERNTLIGAIPDVHWLVSMAGISQRSDWPYEVRNRKGLR